MTSNVFWPFLTYLPFLLYNFQFWGLSWTPLPTLMSDVINGRSKTINLYYNGGLLILTETNQWVALWDQKNQKVQKL